MKIFFWIVVLPISVVVLLFAVFNTQMVDVDLLGHTMPVPLFAVALIGLVGGFIWGGLIAWLHGGKARQRARNYARRAESERRETAILRERLRKLENAEKQATIPLPPANAA
jgi:uncharacterized integral membrane protein